MLRTSHVACGRKRQWCILCVCGALWLAVRIVVHLWVYMANGIKRVATGVHIVVLESRVGTTHKRTPSWIRMFSWV